MIHNIVSTSLEPVRRGIEFDKFYIDKSTVFECWLVRFHIVSVIVRIIRTLKPYKKEPNVCDELHYRKTVPQVSTRQNPL